MKEKNKKGEITSSQIVLTVLLIVGFAIILIFWYAFHPSGAIDKEACHQSVVLRSSFNYGAFEAGKSIPLRCQTEKICLSMSGEDCEEFGKSTRKYPVTKIDVEDKEDIKQALADALYDCNSMLGEGKLDFMPHEFSGTNYCLICSRIAFDEDAKKNIGKLSYNELYEYMSKKKTSSEETYFEYVYPGWSLDGVKKTFDAIKEENRNSDNKNTELENLQFEDWGLNFNSAGEYAILAQTLQKGTWEKWLKIGGVVAGGVITIVGIVSAGFSGPIGVAIAVAGIKLVVGGAVVASGAIYMYDHPNGKYKYVSPTIFPYNLESLQGIKCYSFEIAP